MTICVKGECLLMIWVVAVVCILITIVVVLLSMLTLNKGYGYKHSIDPLPSDIEGETEGQQHQQSASR